ncbi:hypothetical protein Pmani_035387 [Petrolisthes manimaculis]|uniref:Uncharacterized protein n=1 Tax=Petrolisthes manimaculis TaxID=1843537 RepID=A0AAE1NKX0_9EUCA|nr:hypothetical protein Pmani_035387 [Petrolisthes manimaculis]
MNWFDGPAIPVNLFKDEAEEEAEEKNLGTRDTSSDEEEVSKMDTYDDEPWSEDSESDSSRLTVYGIQCFISCHFDSVKHF